MRPLSAPGVYARFGTGIALFAFAALGCAKPAPLAVWGAPPPVMHLTAPPPVAGAHWMSKDYTGGAQCGSPGADDRFSWPTLEAELTKVGLHWDQKILHENAVCAACNCPGYSVSVKLRVRPEDLKLAADAGFKDLNGVPPELNWRKLSGPDDPLWKARVPMGEEPLAVAVRTVAHAEETCIYYRNRFAFEGGSPREVRIYRAARPVADADVQRPTACDEEHAKHELTLHAGDHAEPDLAGVAGEYAAIVWHRSQGTSNIRLLKVYDLLTQDLIYRARIWRSLPKNEPDAFTFARVVAVAGAGGERVEPKACASRVESAWQEARVRHADLTKGLTAPSCDEPKAQGCAFELHVVTRLEPKTKTATRAVPDVSCGVLRGEGALPDEVH